MPMLVVKKVIDVQFARLANAHTTLNRARHMQQPSPRNWLEIPSWSHIFYANVFGSVFEIILVERKEMRGGETRFGYTDAKSRILTGIVNVEWLERERQPHMKPGAPET
jgi:hypothetical protein